MITLGTYFIDYDGACWTLAKGRRKRAPRRPGGQESWQWVSPSYHGNLRQVADKLIDIEAGDVAAEGFEGNMADLAAEIRRRLFELTGEKHT